jgi:hypothetical protein
MIPREKLSFILYGVLHYALIAAVFAGAYYIITKVVGSPEDTSMLILIPGATIAIPAIALGQYIGYKRKFPGKLKKPNSSMERKVNTKKIVFLSMILLFIVISTIEYSVIYLYFRPNYIVGICLAVIGLLALIILVQQSAKLAIKFLL